MKTKLVLILGFLLLFTLPLVVADQTITIQVNNIYTGEPIEGATVEGYVVGYGTTMESLTNLEGIATFDVPDNSLSLIKVSKYAHGEENFEYVSTLTNNNYLQVNLTPLYLFKQVSDENVEITFNLIGNRPDVTYYKNERFNNFLQIKNIGDKDVVFSQETPIKVGYSYFNGPDIDWGKQEHTESITIHPQGYLSLEAIGNDVKLCASGAYAKGIEIGLSSKICMTTPALDKNVIPDNLHGLFYGVVDVSYKIDSTINNIQLTTDNFEIDNYDFWWKGVLDKLNSKFDEFGDIERATNNLTVVITNVTKVFLPQIGDVGQNPTTRAITINLKEIKPTIKQGVFDFKSIKLGNEE